MSFSLQKVGGRGTACALSSVGGQHGAGSGLRRSDHLLLRRACAKAMPDEPTAAVIIGSDRSGRSAVLGALLGHPGPIADPPPGGYVVVRYHPAGTGPSTSPRVGPTRRIDVTSAHALLRHLVLIDAPATDHLGIAGTQVLVDVAGRGGAAVYTARCGDRLTPGEVTVLTALVHAGVAVFFALAPDTAGRWRGPARRGRRIELPDADDPAQASLDTYRSVVAGLVPALADAPWHPVDPPAADAAYLRRALIGWASDEALRRAADNPPLGGGMIVLPAGAGDSRWRTRLDRVHRDAKYAVRHQIALELAGLHLRCARYVRCNSDPAEVLRLFDDELHALSLHANAAWDRELNRMLDEVLGAVFGDGAPHGARAGLRAAVRDRLAAADIAGALLVTVDGAVVAVPGRAAVSALRAYPAPAGSCVLPETSVALAGDFRDPRAPRTHDEILPYVECVMAALDEALSAEVERRFDAVRRALRRVVGDAVHAGILAY
jgi:hypothetical protein